MKSALTPHAQSLLHTLTLCLLACDASVDESDNSPTVETARSALARDLHPTASAADLMAQAKGDASFAADLYRLRVSNAPEENQFFSPHSISSAFALLYGGSAGATKTDIEKVLHFSGADGFHAARNRLALDLAARSNGEGGYELALSNAFWGEKSFVWEAPYLDLLAKNYGSGINLANFIGAPEPSRQLINRWVEDQTENRVRDLLPPKSISEDTRFALVNAVYFRSRWLAKFHRTTSEFHRGDASTTVPVIQATSDSFRYVKTDDVVAVSVPYESGAAELVVIQPNDLGAFEQKMNGETLDAIVDTLAPTNVQLTMPMLKIAGNTIALKEDLKSLGLGSIFDRSNFTPMTLSGPLLIANVYHQAFLKLDEEGTEAAAATVILGADGGVAAPREVTKVNIDRPYVFVIRDIATRAILFEGRIVAPSFSE